MNLVTVIYKHKKPNTYRCNKCHIDNVKQILYMDRIKVDLKKVKEVIYNGLKIF